MDMSRYRFNRQAARTVAIVAVTAIVAAGGAWRVGAAEQPNAPAPVTDSRQVRGAALADGRTSYADIVKIVAPAVVTIRTESAARVSPASFPGDDFFRQFFGDRVDQTPRPPQTYRQRGLGSGVVVSADGYVLTNHHVVDNADDIRVDLADGRTLKATMIGSDQPSDLALLKIGATGLHPLTLGNSDAVQVGDVVLAIGNPLGVGQTVTMGIISAKGRATGLGEGAYEDFLQTDAPINQGNSGGALVDTNGALIGINSQILSPSGGSIGIGFAIPTNMARHVMDQLRTSGHVRRAQLGVGIQPLTADLATSLGIRQTSGALVSSVAPDSPAAHAGVKRGDVITAFNGEPISDANTLRNRVADTTPGSQATLTVVRDGGEHRMTVQLGEMRESERHAQRGEPAGGDDTSFGVAVTPITPELASQLGLSSRAKGLVVQEVQPESPAAEAGLQPGDVIEEVNRQPVSRVDQLRAAVGNASDRPMLLLVNRDGADLYLTARMS